MSYQDVPADLLSRLSHRLRDQLYSMITIPDPPNPMEPSLQSRASSLGTLDRLPVELLYEVLMSLDFQSSISFSRASIQGKNIVCSLPAYRDVMKHAPHALAALSRTKLLHFHSASDLHNALRNERCATCPEYGVYLFLPTCERCCWQCLRSKPTRRVVSPTAATKTFALSPKMVRQLPVMFSIPGTYGVACKPTQKSYRLVSVTAAKELAMSIYGSPGDAIEAIIRRRPPNERTESTARSLRAIFSDFACLDSLMVPDQGNTGVDRYFGMASIPFPSLTTPDILEHGLWCKGCEWTFNQHRGRRIPAYVIANMVPADCDPDRVLLGMVRRAYSSVRLSAHIQHCYGAQQLLASQMCKKVERVPSP
ncbi:F-box domain-containing protein [Xylaria bambusicola]|uniref:F-box domain-containing protein n=1 Tax=Xylaria bambusicola TaxID=326684 RepID=UPI002007745A|nr:F-box domain-containing protein [Xylaria bambusicola]KAI0515409.1 F-box domain-containing protein [Xylaria bambusicola]